MIASEWYCTANDPKICTLYAATVAPLLPLLSLAISRRAGRRRRCYGRNPFSQSKFLLTGAEMHKS